MFYKPVKRLLDIMLSILALVVLSPVLLIIALIIKFESAGPVLFTQKRVGLHKTHFNIIKFRTMHEGSPANVPTHMFENPEQYITKTGKFLRRTSLNELPQLVNILRGEMSIIGPRPALWNQYDLIAERDKYGANDIRPGLSGWAAINGRDTLEIDVKARFDGEYVKKMSFVFDAKCIIGTILTVLTNTWVVEGGTSALDGTMELEKVYRKTNKHAVNKDTIAK